MLFVRLKAKAVDQVLPFIRNMLRQLRQKFECIKNLKIAHQAGLEPLVPKFGKSHTLAFAGAANHLTFFRNLDHLRQGQGATRNNRDQPLHLL
jgi:hypothetical protein